MKALGLYAAAGLAVVSVVTAGAWMFLTAGEREGMLTAAAIALPLQVAFFALLFRARSEPSRFLAWWAAGILGRMVVMAAVGLSLGRLGVSEPGALLMSLAGFLFALLLIEPLFLDRQDPTAQLAQ